MTFNTEKIKEQAKRDFRKTWLETGKLIQEKSDKSFSGGKGKPHAVQELVESVRKIFLELGFDEVENPLFVSEDDVYKQYGPEAPVILDRVYYLAGLPRPDIGLGRDTIEKIREIAKIDIEKFKDILRAYREGTIEGDDLLETMVNGLKIKTEDAAQIINLFPEFRNITPVPGKSTLRSHMTAAWFPTLQALKAKSALPLKLFSVGLRFRREQRMDAGHLRAHYGGSMVVMDDTINIEAGKELTEEILKKLGFKDIKFVQKKATSNYYAPETEYEVYSGKIEIADIGMYSPVALANYDIPYNVFNLGFGLERMLMVKHGIDDVREVLYPQYYGAVELTNKEIAAQITIDKKPSEARHGTVSALKRSARQLADKAAPSWDFIGTYDVMALKDGQKVAYKFKVEVGEDEPGKKVLGPAALNRIYVYDGEIIAVPPKSSPKRKSSEKLDRELFEIEAKGVDTKITILDAISNYFIYKIEKQIQEGKASDLLQVGMAKGPSDVNIKVGEQARRFIESKNKRIFIKGPVFMNVRYKVLEPD